MKEYSNILISLLKGIVYSHSKYWDDLLKHKEDVEKHFSDINLNVIIDKSEGYAYLKQKEIDDEDEETLRLIEKRPLNFHISLLCLLLRKHLIESDNEGASDKVIISKDQIINLMKPFYKETTNEAKQIAQITTAINKVADKGFGFLRQMDTEEELYEVSRIIRAFIDADIVKGKLEELKNNTKSVEENA
ncbi:hypothetical protein R83H12_00676 [Fibrobacteria bacterium R8-3-H12]